jgi:predicted Zn-dependent protease
MTGPSVTEIAEQTLDLVRRGGVAVEAEVSVDRERLALTRFANSVIHQNVAEDGTSVHVRVHHDGRTASASSTRIDADGLRELVERTIDTVRHAPRDPGWPGLTPPSPPATTAAVDEATVEADPDARAAIVRAFVDAAGGLETAGSCRTTAWDGAFVNSAGHASAGRNAEVAVDGIARVEGADGVARVASSRLGDVDGAILGARAAAKAKAGGDPIELPPGRYAVVLEPEAVADILNNFALYGFNGKAVNERRSFAEVGVDQFDPAVAIVDDAPATGWSHDAEGTPRRRHVLVDGGRTVAVTHDRRTAAEAGTESTGHATGYASWGAFPTHLAMAPWAGEPGEGPVPEEVDGPAADAAVAALVARVDRGLLVTDLWYTRVLDPRTLAVTGLTRNGVWLVENGEIGPPVRNLRFTQEYPAALAPGAVLGVGTSSVAQPDSWVTARWTAPALCLASWNFTGGASG